MARQMFREVGLGLIRDRAGKEGTLLLQIRIVSVQILCGSSAQQHANKTVAHVSLN